MFSNIKERLDKELSLMVPETVKVNVICPNERKFSVWIGGGVISSLAMFASNWITRAEYEEAGPGIVLRKCI